MSLKIFTIDEQCTGCGACISICPKQALSLEYNEEGFYYPKLNPTLCINCKACEKVCHVLNLVYDNTISKQYTALMIKSKSQTLLKQSSSGGIFSLLATQVMSEGGVVYGARYNYLKERLEHCSTNECNINELRKSKYIESFLGNTFEKVKKQLIDGKTVLFCGTPCQIDGLNRFLNQKKSPKDKLITVRFVCHGVPSNKFFTEYKHWIEKKIGSQIIKLDFRPKNKGWRFSNLLLEFSNGKIIDEPHNHNYYYYFFQHNFFLRKSCYTCKRIYNESSDFTIADFWGIYKYQPNNNDQEGISLVLLHSKISHELFNKIKPQCNFELLPQTAVDYIYNDISWREECYQSRNEMSKEIIKKGYMEVAIKKIWKTIFINKQKERIKSIIKKILLWKS